MEWLIYERSNGQPVALLEDSDPDRLTAEIARSVVMEKVRELCIVFLDCDGEHPRRDCACIACEVARGNQSVILIGSG